MYELVVAVHVLAAIVGFGAVFTYPLVERAAGHAAVLSISRRLAVPGALVVGATGVYQVADGPYALGDTWLALGVALYVVVMLVAVTVLAPAYRRAAETARGSDERRRAEARISLGGPPLALAVAAIVVLMVMKPG